MTMPGPETDVAADAVAVCANEDCVATELVELLRVGLAGRTMDIGECEAVADEGCLEMVGMPATPGWVGVGIGVLCVELAAVKFRVLGCEMRVWRLPW